MKIKKSPYTLGKAKIYQKHSYPDTVIPSPKPKKTVQDGGGRRTVNFVEHCTNTEIKMN